MRTLSRLLVVTALLVGGVVVLGVAVGLGSAPAGAAPAQDGAEGDDGAPPVARGDTGTLVAWWQDRLNDWIALADTPLDPIAVDGIFGPETETATTTFQDSVADLPTDAVVDPVDRVTLRDRIEALEGNGTAPGDGTADDPDTATETSPGFPAAGEPSLLSSVDLLGTDGRVALLSFDFAEAGDDLSYRVGYVDEVTDTAGAPVEVAGDAVLEVVMSPASTVDLSGERPEPVYTGPDRIAFDSSDVVAEAALAESFEGTTTWAVGLTEEVPFDVRVDPEPRRLTVELVVRS